MEADRSIRLQAGCAILFLFDLIAFCALLYFSLVAGLLFPTDCTIEREHACDVARAVQLQRLGMVFCTTVAVNTGFIIWAVSGRRRSH